MLLVQLLQLFGSIIVPEDVLVIILQLQARRDRIVVRIILDILQRRLDHRFIELFSCDAVKQRQLHLTGNLHHLSDLVGQALARRHKR